eukprot:TRINITY_DN6478_c0_g1_i1.p1 TRINITY_DN6478_c0_g1~~TRINITY_DN6478_c0_g1_i1.p1  ORF type:complete len:252 (-),score=78.92 TRINITY_DN6478_c0_g1_i1:228-983(-)
MEKMRQRVDRTRQDGREDDLVMEVDHISRAYEDLSQQNTRLLAQLDEKDRMTSNLLTERLKHQHTIALLKAEAEATGHALEAAERLRANHEAWLSKTQDAIQTLHAEEKQSSRQCQELQAVATQQDRELVSLREEAVGLRRQVERQREAAAQFTAHAEQLARQATEAGDLHRQRGEELQRLQSKYEWLRKKHAEAAPKVPPPWRGRRSPSSGSRSPSSGPSSTATCAGSGGKTRSSPAACTSSARSAWRTT